MDKRKKYCKYTCLEKINKLKKESDCLAVSLSPAIGQRIAADCFLPYGSEFEKKLVGGVHGSGADYVFNLAECAEAVLREEAEALIQWSEQKRDVPYITGFCPAGADYIKKYCAGFKSGISKVVSPAARQDKIVRFKLRDISRLAHIIVVPCEYKRKEVESAVREKQTIVFSGEELRACLEITFPAFDKIEKKEYDHLLYSKEIHPENGIADMVMTLAAKKPPGYHFGTVAAVKGKRELMDLCERISKGEKFDYIEVLACSQGCMKDGD